MIETFVMTILAADRPGLVDRVAACVADHGANWLESRMCHLGGRFAGIVRVAVPAGRAAELRRALQGLEADGLRVGVESGGAPATAGGVGATLELVGQDRPGLLRTLTAVLAAHGVNVEELTSECVSAPMGGGELFQARVRLLAPAAARLAEVRAELEKIAADLMVDVKLHPAD